MAPDLSIVVVSWNTRDDLRACLAAVPAACGALSHEIVVVDNASRDGTPAMVRAEFPGVTLIETGANLGFAAGNNRALPACSGRILVLLNPDTVAEPGSLARLAAFLPLACISSRVCVIGPGARLHEPATPCARHGQSAYPA